MIQNCSRMCSFLPGEREKKKKEKKCAAGRTEHPCSSDGRIAPGHSAAAPAESRRSSALQIMSTKQTQKHTCGLTEGSPWQSRWGWASRPLAKYQEEEQFSLWVQLWGDTKREKVCGEDQWGRTNGRADITRREAWREGVREGNKKTTKKWWKGSDLQTVGWGEESDKVGGAFNICFLGNQQTIPGLGTPVSASGPPRQQLLVAQLTSVAEWWGAKCTLTVGHYYHLSEQRNHQHTARQDCWILITHIYQQTLKSAWREKKEKRKTNCTRRAAQKNLLNMNNTTVAVNIDSGLWIARRVKMIRRLKGLHHSSGWD